MKTYKFYLDASNHFLNTPIYDKLDQKQKEYYHFASVVLSWICLESYINMISESLSKGTRLKPHEMLFLLEREFKVNDDGSFQEIVIKPNTTKKILYIIHHFSKVNVKDFKNLKLWTDLQEFEDIRNKIIHHKEKNNLNINLAKATKYRDLVDSLTKYINKVVVV